jgi:hypothetical protein
MAAPYNAVPPGEAAAMAMLAQNVPMGVVRAGATAPPGAPTGLVQAHASAAPGAMPPITPATFCGPGGCPPGAAQTGPMGVPYTPMASSGPNPVGGTTGAGSACRFPAHRTSVRFVSPIGMQVAWYAPSGDGHAGFAGNVLAVPDRYNFAQAAIYRLKLSNLPNRPGVALYPTLEVVPANAKTETFLAHSSVPLAFTEEDFEQVAAGNFVVKVIYLPDPQFQDLATTGPDEVVSTRLEPGVDPVAEACRRGSILLVVRLGNIDLEAAHTPGMDTPSPYMNNNCMMPPGAAPMGAMMPGPGMPMGPMSQGKALPMGVGNPMMAPAMPTSGMPMMQRPGMPNATMPMMQSGMPPMMQPGMPTSGPVSQMPQAAPYGKLPDSGFAQPMNSGFAQPMNSGMPVFSNAPMAPPPPLSTTSGPSLGGR